MKTLPNGEKRCSTCHQVKPATSEHFYASRSQVDGRQARCIACDKERARAMAPRLSASIDVSIPDYITRTRERARRVAARVHRAPSAANYRGVRGGPLLSGYVR